MNHGLSIWQAWCKKGHMNKGSVYFEVEGLFTLWHFIIYCLYRAYQTADSLMCDVGLKLLDSSQSSTDPKLFIWLIEY